MLTALAALRRLREGNERFVANQTGGRVLSMPSRGSDLVAGQEPFAIILGCSDSRVPAELIFDEGFGDLFVIRVAGNIVAPSQVGSVEFAAARFGTRLVVVLGHSHCGAVRAALDELEGRVTTESKNLRSIVDRVRPPLEILLASRSSSPGGVSFTEAVRANVRASANHLRHGSELLERLDGLLVVGAEYSIETGMVDFFEGVPASFDQS